MPTNTTKRKQQQAVAVIPKPLVEIGVKVVEENGLRMVEFPPKLKQACNVLLPVNEIVQSDSNYSPSVRMVMLDAEHHTYGNPQWKQNRALNKQGLEILGNLAGVVEMRAVRMDRSVLTDREIGYEGVVKIRRSDGSLMTIRKPKVIDKNVEYERIVQQAKKAAKSYEWSAEKLAEETEKRWLSEQEHLDAKCESKAVLRALRSALQIPHQFNPGQLKRPFLVVGWNFTPDWSDREVRRMLVANGVASSKALYAGGRRPEDEAEPGDAEWAHEPQEPLGEAELAEAREPDPGDEPDDDVVEGEVVGYDEQILKSEPPPPAVVVESPDRDEPLTAQGEASADVAVPFGRHSGKTLRQIAEDENDPGYIRWLSGENVQNPIVRRAAQLYVRQWLDGEPRD
jgi:hypothetical protein